MSTHHIAAFCLIFSAHAAIGETEANASSGGSRLFDTNGLLMLDYQSLDLTTGGKFDLHGVHYLHQINEWLYAGLGYSAPLFQGNYGGFFSADFTLHAQQKLIGDVFFDAGVSVGAGAGGDSVRGIKPLSGDGTYLKTYAGLGYDFGSFSLGVNFADVRIANSAINDSAVSFFFQKAMPFSAGHYGETGRPVDPADFARLGNETIIGFEYSNMRQLNPAGSYGGDIGLISPHMTQFFDPNYYTFIGLDLGASGLVWYNQAQLGLGARVSPTDNINLYAQIGIGSGGWVTDTFDTGPGLVIYPKVKAEYMVSNSTGLFVSAGYLTSPFGTSNNWTLGAGVNFHLPSAREAMGAEGQAEDVALHGVRVSLFGRVSFDVEDATGAIDDLYMNPVQVDYKFAPNWYAAAQIAPAVNDYKGNGGGYVEGFAGLGWEGNPFLDGRLQPYGQVLAGLNDTIANPGLLIAPSVGLSYNITDRYSIYSQIGKTFSVGNYLDPTNTNLFRSTSVGLGVSYRFGVPTWSSR